MKFVRINSKNLQGYTKVRSELFDMTWRGILPDSWLNRQDEKTTKAKIEDSISKGREEVLVTSDLSEPMGYISFGKSRDNSSLGEIISIYFYPKFHGKLYAHKAFKYAEQKLYDKGFKTLQVWVLEINSRARRFYEKNGYVPTGKTRIQNCDAPFTELEYQKESF